MSFETFAARRRQFEEEGYCRFEGILDSAMLAELVDVTDTLLMQCSREDAELYRYQGSNIATAYQHTAFVRLYAWPAALAALRSLGFDDPRFWSGFLLSKPPHAPPLYWHQDWWAWQDAVSGNRISPQVFLMYYLSDTTVANGCLRVIPGSHVRRTPLHDMLPDAHTEATYKASLDSPLFADYPGAADVPVNAGDLLIGDARLFHAAHANTTDRRRSCLTLWYMPEFASLPESIRAFVATHRPLPPPGFEETEEGQLMESLLPRYTGAAKPAAFNRTPKDYPAPDKPGHGSVRT